MIRCAYSILVFSAAALFVSAEPAAAIEIETVAVLNAGNPADMRYADSLHPNGIGSVAYPFRIGKTEITNSQYTAFLNAVAASDTYGLFGAGDSFTGTW